MDRTEAIKIIENEAECVIRAAGCGRKCGSCDLLRLPSNILLAYYMAIAALKEPTVAHGRWIFSHETSPCATVGSFRAAMAI